MLVPLMLFIARLQPVWGHLLAWSCDVFLYSAQILGQLGPVEEVSAGLRKLRDEAQRWVEEAHKPLLVPQTRCLPMPDRGLIASIDLTIYYPGGMEGDIFDFRCKVKCWNSFEHFPEHTVHLLLTLMSGV